MTKLLDLIARLYWRATLVHADLSEYNVLYYQAQPVLIDVGQAVTIEHPHAKEFLVRDVERVVDWGNRCGVELELADAMYQVLSVGERTEAE